MATGDIIISNNTITPEILATIASEVVDLISTTSKDPGEYEEVTSLTGVSSLPVFQISNNVYRLVRVAMSVLQGTDGREVELQVTDEYIQWRYAGDYWKNLIAIVNLKGDPGETPVFRTSSVGIEWKYESESDESYRELIAIDDLKLNFSDLTDEQKEELKLHFSDLSDEDLDLLKQPATEAASEVRSDMDKIKEEAESVNQTLTDEIEAIKQEANTLIDETNAAKEAAEVATANAISVSDHPGYIGEDYHVYTWDYTIDSYVKTDTILRPEGFSIYRSYSSIDEMNADLGNVPEGKFVLINTDDVEQEDNAKLYVRGTTAFEYLVDMSGAIGFTGKTPQFSIGTVMDGENVGVSISSDGYDDSANPKYKLNFVIKRGAQGFAPIIEAGEISTLEPGEDVSATLQFKENNEDGIPVYTLNISIPKGDKGNIGDTGKTPILSQVEAESGELPSGNFVEDGVDDKGNPQYKLSLILPKGENGLPPVFEKGTITTVDASTNADVEVVENGYTESGNPIFVLNFSIPKGKDGEGQGNVSVIDNTGLVSGVKYLFVPDSTGSTEGKFVEYIEPDIPKKVSELSNDSNFIDNSVSNLLNYYLKSETYSRQEVLDLIGDITTVTFQVVDVRPTTGEGNIIYLVPSDSSEDENVKDEYIYIDGSWELIGTTKIDLTGYLTKTEADAKYWHSGNDGSGSGLDADMLDGFSAKPTVTGYDHIRVIKGHLHSGNATLKYYRLGYLPTVANTGNGMSFAQISFYGGGDYGANTQHTYQIVFGTRGVPSLYCIRDGINTDKLVFGYVVTDDNVELWVNPTTGYHACWTWEIKNSSAFTLDGYTEVNEVPEGLVEATYYDIAHTNQNVASATKLATARSIWGQSFNGTGDVDGKLTINNTSDTLSLHIKDNTASAIYDWKNEITALCYNLANSSRVAFALGKKLEAGNNSGYFSYYHSTDNSSNNALRLGLNSIGDILNILSSGNVGIGTVDPQAKLHVSGSIQAEGLLTFSGLSNFGAPAIKFPKGEYISGYGNFVLDNDNSESWNVGVKKDGTVTNLFTVRTSGLVSVGSGGLSVDGKIKGNGSDITNINDSYIAYGHGSTPLTQTISPIDMACSYLHSANRLQFAKPAGITIEYSTDAGLTWVDYEATDEQKTGLVSGLDQSFIIGKGATASTNNQLRITLHASNMNVYTYARSMLIKVTTNGATGTYVTVEASYKGSEDTFTTLYNKQAVSGWSGWNKIPMNYAFGGNPTQGRNVAIIRLTFGCTAISTDFSSRFSILSIMILGDACWTYNSQMAKTGHIYTWDAYQNTTFPNKVIAPLFSGNGSSLTSLNASNISSGTLAKERLATSGVTAGSYGPTAAVTGNNGTTINIPQITVDEYGRVTSVVNRVFTAVNTDTNTTYSAATTSANGLMSSTDKTKMDRIRSYTTATTVASLNVNYEIIYVTLTANASLSAASTGTAYNGRTITAYVYTAAARTITIPTTGNYVSMCGSSFTTVAGGWVEFNLTCINGIWHIAKLEQE